MTDVTEFDILDPESQPPIAWDDLAKMGVEVRGPNVPNNPNAVPASVEDMIFYIWYNANKPTSKNLKKILPEEFVLKGGKSAKNTVSQHWLDDAVRRFAVRADEMDEAVRNQLESLVIEKKIEMFERHSAVAEEMQTMSINYLREHKDEMSAGVAIRMLVEGIRIERESRGVPEALKKMQTLSDEQLLDELKKLVSGSPVSPLEDNASV